MEEYETKKNHKELIITIIIAIILIAIFSAFGIKLAEEYNKKIIARKMENKQKIEQELLITSTKNEDKNMVENQSKEEDIGNINEPEESVETFNSKKLPVYSENAKSKMKNIYNSDKKVAYLTFDDGPSQTVTPLILDLLKKEDVKVTFFALGSSIKANPELVKREYEEGHYIANHGYSHNYKSIYNSLDNLINEYNKTEKEIQKAIGVKEYHSHLFRFPGGSTGGKYADFKATAKKELNKQDISFLDWNALTSDAAGANTKQKILDNLKSTVEGKKSVVILMHDASNKILTYETLPDVIKYLRDEEYSFDNFYSIMK